VRRRRVSYLAKDELEYLVKLALEKNELENLAKNTLLLLLPPLMAIELPDASYAPGLQGTVHDALTRPAAIIRIMPQATQVTADREPMTQAAVV